ncbi:MAG: hypothetical protein HYY06_26605 [Deltaproteobacteria bacterium]|nr:hypothetical protein [Deltaproteobacteria bacterium]
MSAPYAEPRRLAELAQRLAAIAAAPLPGNRSVDLRALLRRLTERLRTVIDDDAAVEIVAGLDPREQRALVGLIPLFEDDAVARLAALAVARVQRRQFSAMAPQFLIRHYRRPFAQIAAAAFVDIPPAEATARLRMVASVRRNGLEGQERELVNALMREEVAWRRVCEGVGAAPGQSELASALAFALLSAADSRHLVSQPYDDLQGCFRLVARDEWPRVVNHYFSVLGPVQFSEAALDAVVRELGPPRTSRDPRWGQISAEVADRIHEELIQRSLRKFFAGQENHERLSFWSSWASRIRRVYERLEGSAYLMDFGKFGVIEFRDVGNAAYFYPPDEFARLLQVRATSPSSLKVPSRALERLRHSQGWREKCRQLLWSLVQA